LEGWKKDVHRVGNTSYYVVVPPGKRPAKGWPTLVALHGYGGNGEFALVAFGDFAVREGVLLIAPTFGDYRYPYDRYTLPVLNDIIQQVNRDYGLDPFGAVFYGFSAGGQISTFYAGLYPQWVAGVTAEAAPEIHPPPTSRGLPYNILYGENDSERYVAADSVNRLIGRGYPVRYEIVPGVGHDMTPLGFALAKEMVRTTFNK
jgi:pimeloyl-ACP methyl ester carboxylesterase